MKDTQPPATAEQGYAAAETLFAERLRALREAANMTQGQLAERMTQLGFSMHQTTIAKVEKSQRPVRLNEAVAFAAVLNVQVTDLLTDTESTPESAALWTELNALIAVRVENTRRLEMVEEQFRELGAHRAQLSTQLESIEQHEADVRERWQAARVKAQAPKPPKVSPVPGATVQSWDPAIQNGGPVVLLFMLASYLWKARRDASKVEKVANPSDSTSSVGAN
ncbi:MAG TPA: helix-turn-helix domain-containing protein [Streptosporangiaceae bacterium]|nr:helix-turn-helix domain-containing protein [Streptosporangiaceae bacterium]